MRDPVSLTFDADPEDRFAALSAAERWCRENGVSYGSQQRDAPIGLARGDAYIAKWRNLSKWERERLDGTITFPLGTGGPVKLALRPEAKA